MFNMDHYKRCYKNQKDQARRRKIEWQLDFDTWMCWWIGTGHLHERGRRKGEWVMSRVGDVGPYSLNNIVCKLASSNAAEGTKNSKLNGTYGTNPGNYWKPKKNKEQQ